MNTHLLSRNCRYASLVSATLAAVITPTADPFNMKMLRMVPLVRLHEIGTLASRLAWPANRSHAYLRARWGKANGQFGTTLLWPCRKRAPVL